MKTTLNLKAWIPVLFMLATACSRADQQPEEEAEQPAAPDSSGQEHDRAYWERAELVWADEFDGNALDADKWLFETGAHGWGNNEWQNYVAGDNVEVSQGILKITAKKTGAGQKAGDYTSARLNSRESFTYGRMEIRAKIPEHQGNGVWPALWMLGQDIKTTGWPGCGEIDIMEYVSYDPDTFHFSIHSTANNHKDGTQVTSGRLPLEDIEEEFHSYGILWTENYISFYLDDIENVKLSFSRPRPSTVANWPFSRPFYFLMNMAVGGDWGGQKGVEDEIFPSVLEVDYVRVYQH